MGLRRLKAPCDKRPKCKNSKRGSDDRDRDSKGVDSWRLAKTRSQPSRPPLMESSEKRATTNGTKPLRSGKSRRRKRGGQRRGRTKTHTHTRVKNKEIQEIENE